MKFTSFGLKSSTASANPDVNTFGGKGAGLIWMHSQGIKVPPGFVIPTTVCAQFQQDKNATMAVIAEEVKPFLAKLKAHYGYMPLLSVRSGARVSMPGMMDTILNVGLDDTTHQEWMDRLGPACAIDCKRRLVEMFGATACGIPKEKFHGKAMIENMAVFQDATGHPFPDVEGQLLGSIAAVFESWNNERAIVYRNMKGYPHTWGTAVTVQSMVFGNMGQDSATGVLFTRNPVTGSSDIMGEFAINAQGEDVVNGSTTPKNLGDMPEWNGKVYTELCATVKKLEVLKKYPQDVEFTIQQGVLYILQTRNAKREARAALSWAVQLAEEEVLTLQAALKSVSAREFDTAQRAVIDPAFKVAPNFTGLAACSGVAQGRIVKSVASAVASKEPCVLVSSETTPEDLVGMIKAEGILTMTGGMTSHAAVVARSLDKPCIVGLTEKLSQFAEGALITLDGGTGRVWIGHKVPVVDPTQDATLGKFRAMMRAAVGGVLISSDPHEMPDYLFIADSLMLSKTEVAARIEIVASKKPVKVIFDTKRGDVTEFYTMLGVKPLERAEHILNECMGKPWIGNVAPIMKGLDHAAVQGPIKNLEALLMASGDQQIDPDFAKTASAQKALAWKKEKEGWTPGNGSKVEVVSPFSYAQMTELLAA